MEINQIKDLDRNSFNREKGERLKQYGLQFAELKTEERQDLVKIARELARKIAMERDNRRLTVDAVYKVMLEQGHDPSLLGNAWGSIFKCRGWRFTGEYKKSERVSNHARIVRVWELVG